MSKKQDEKLDTYYGIIDIELENINKLVGAILEKVDKLQNDMDFVAQACDWQDHKIRDMYNEMFNTGTK